MEQLELQTLKELILIGFLFNLVFFLIIIYHIKKLRVMTKAEYDDVIAKMTSGLSRVSAAIKASANNVKGGLTEAEAEEEFTKLSDLANEIDALAPDTTETGTQG